MKIVAIDVETTGLSPHKDRLLGMSLADDSGSTYYRWLGGRGVTFTFPFDQLRDPEIKKVGHNLRFDLKFLQINGVEIQGQVEDTLLMAHLLNENEPHGLKVLVKKYLGDTYLRYYTQLLEKLKLLKLTLGDLDDPRVDRELVGKYCAEDAGNTLELYKILAPQLKSQPHLFQYYREEMLPLETVLRDMELQGNRVNLPLLKEADEMLEVQINNHLRQLNFKLSKEIRAVCQKLHDTRMHKAETNAKHKIKVPRYAFPPEFNWNSNNHKRELFYNQLGLKDYCKAKTIKDNDTLNKDVLSTLKLPDGKLKWAIDTQVTLNNLTRMKATYVGGINERRVGDKIYGEYNQARSEHGGTVTGRLSHSNPNLGNLPRGTDDYWAGGFVKDLFIPPEGHVFLYADYSQIELRVAAHLSQDQSFLNSFNSDEDPHQKTADALKLEGIEVTRQEAKTINFLMIYGGSPRRLCMELKKDPEDSQEYDLCRRIIDKFFGHHAQLNSWLKLVQRLVLQQGWIDSMFGKRRRLPEVWSWDKQVKRRALKQASNFVVQSAAASICKRAMIELRLAGFQICNQVHDSITCIETEDKASESLERMVEIMCRSQITVPLRVDSKILRTFKE